MTTFLCPIHEDLKKDLFTIDIQGQLRSHHQVQIFSNDHVKFELQDGLFYCDGLLYVFYDHMRLQVLQVRHHALVVSHFGFNKTMELMF
jgi:hypothetical protein